MATSSMSRCEHGSLMGREDSHSQCIASPTEPLLSSSPSLLDSASSASTSLSSTEGRAPTQSSLSIRSWPFFPGSGTVHIVGVDSSSSQSAHEMLLGTSESVVTLGHISGPSDLQNLQMHLEWATALKATAAAVCALEDKSACPIEQGGCPSGSSSSASFPFASKFSDDGDAHLRSADASGFTEFELAVLRNTKQGRRRRSLLAKRPSLSDVLGSYHITPAAEHRHTFSCPTGDRRYACAGETMIPSSLTTSLERTTEADTISAPDSLSSSTKRRRAYTDSHAVLQDPRLRYTEPSWDSVFSTHSSLYDAHSRKSTLPGADDLLDSSSRVSACQKPPNERSGRTVWKTSDVAKRVETPPVDPTYTDAYFEEIEAEIADLLALPPLSQSAQMAMRARRSSAQLCV